MQLRRLSLGLVLVALISGCGDEAASSDAPTTSDVHGAPVKAGSVVDLAGPGTEAIQARVTGIVDPLTGLGSVDTPAEGRRFVGVELTLKNAGPTEYNASPSNGATLIFDDDHQASATLVTTGPCAGGFAARTDIASGQQRKGCIAFEVPDERKPKWFAFTIDPDLRGKTGLWDVSTRAAAIKLDGSGTNTSALDGRTADKVCDENINVSASTPCPFAGNVFRAYVKKVRRGADADTFVYAYNVATAKTLKMTCTVSDDFVSCTGGKKAVIDFSMRAVRDY